MPTRYTTEAQTGDQGVAFVRYVAAQVSCIYRPFDNADLGIDGALEVLNENREPSGDMVLVQVKSGSSYVGGNRYYVRGDRDHFEVWSRYAIPVVGIVHNPRRSDARWVNISEHLQRHPDRITTGPYNIVAPASQPFSIHTFHAFAERFRRQRPAATRVEVTPNLLIRPWQPADANPTRVLLSSIANDYPNFFAWLERQWQRDEVSKKVVEVGHAIAAYSMWSRKDPQNVKLQTFIVGTLFRGTATGQHLLYHEMRTWEADQEIERVYVTISRTKADLIRYFRRFGFRVEGVAANRYCRRTHDAELVLVKHFVRETVRTPAELLRVTDEIARKIWGINSAATTSTRFGIEEADFSMPIRVPHVRMEVNRAPRTVTRRVAVVDDAGEEVLTYNDESLMREFYPLRLHLVEKLYVLVPIYPRWVENMLATTSGSEAQSTALKLRIDNVYYCYPRLMELRAGDFVIFYETRAGGGRASAIGAAIVREAAFDSPDRLFARFSSLGVYELGDIQGHTRNGVAMAIHFDFFEPFSSYVSLNRIRGILGHHTNVQGLTPVLRNAFERIRQEGLS